MKKGRKAVQKILATLVSICIVLTSANITAFAADPATDTRAGQHVAVADPGTAHSFETILGTDKDGNRYAGRLWVDKSVYTDGQTAVLNTTDVEGATFDVSLQDDEAFQVIFSVLGTSMTTTTTSSSTGPMDVVLVLDSSGSMTSSTGGKTRFQRVIEASNRLIDDLLVAANVRLGIVSYNAESHMILGLNSYTNGVTLSVNSYNMNGGVIRAVDDSGRELGRDEGMDSGTNLQAGIDRGMNMLATATNVSGRKPILIVLTDGAANHAVTDNWYNVSAGSVRNGGDAGAGVTLSTLLNAAYNKARIEDNYKTPAVVYGVSVDLSANNAAHALMNPGSQTNGFNRNNRNSDIANAYSYYLQWADGRNVSFSSSGNWKFNQLPTNATVSRADVIANINYVDHYYDVSGVDLENAFEQIYEELTSGAFNPITDSTTVVGGTGANDAPLIYVDNIGQYMEVKEIQAVTLFGSSYGVTKNRDGTYTVQAGTGTNPTTNEAWDTSRDIKISVTEDTDGSQKLEVKINQEILPIILEQVVSNTVGDVTTATITELLQRPLRVFYTVGLDTDILLPTGDIDLTKIDETYPYKDGETITFYSNEFGVLNTEDADTDGIVDYGDAHVGFKPSDVNRYYYHPANQGVFTAVARKDGAPVRWEEGEYGVLYEENTYNFTYLTYEDYATYNGMAADQQVYTYVTFYRPTPSALDAASAAEEVTYLVYTNWGDLKESIAFYDYNAGTYINYKADGNTYTTGDTGYAMPEDKIESVLAAYMRANRNADIRAMLGVGSLRTSRFHNMIVEKEENNTKTAQVRYAPQYTHDTAEQHNGNDVVVWLGNNGRLTMTANTGIALTKSVTEAIGNANDRYALTVTIPSNVTATPVVKDASGNNITASVSTYLNRVLTVNIKAGETVYISGIPAGTECIIGENISTDADYRIASKTEKVTIPTMEQVIGGTAAQYVAANVTNTPNRYGNLYITKEIISTNNHAIPDSMLEEDFTVVVNVGTDLAGKTFTIERKDLDDETKVVTSSVTVDSNGTITLALKARETIEILRLPEGITATITEDMTTEQDVIFDESYTTRNQSGVNADSDNEVTIVANANATAIVINDYTPDSTTVDLDIDGTKNFVVEEGITSPAATFNFKVQSWNGERWVDMDGLSTSVSYNAGVTGEKPFTFQNVLEGITYTQTGSWAYQVVEEIGSEENVTYDRTLYTFTVTVTDDDGKLVATVTDLNNEEIDGSYDVTFTNTYNTAPISIDIAKIVNNDSGNPDMDSPAGFTFKIEGTDENWVPKAGYDPLYVYSDAAGEARLSRTYTEEGNHYYLISEVDEKKAGWTYSGAKYRVKVVVEDKEGNGNLTATMTIEPVSGTTSSNEVASVVGDDEGKISFANTYDPTDATVDLDLAVEKDLQGRDLEAGEFTFKVYKDGTTENAVLTGTNAKDGSVDFDGVLTFDKVGKYLYDIVEVDENLDGVTYDSTIYDLVVEVKNDAEAGKLVAEYYFEDAVGQTVTFENTYYAEPTQYTIEGTKTLHGRSAKVGEFTFELYEEGNPNPIDTATNTAAGAFAFETITYDKAGTYTYTVKEVEGTVAGITYTGVNNPITVTITVTDTNAVLSASAKFEKQNGEVQSVEFENFYEAEPATVAFQGTKTLEGRTLEDDMFVFKLYQTTNTFDITGLTAVDEVKNKGEAFLFDEIEFDKTGTYDYVIVEDATDPISDIVYDSTQYRFRIQVSDIGDGQLRAVVLNINNGVTTTAAASTSVDVAFTNAAFDEVTEKAVFLADDITTRIDKEKVEAGDILTYYITYTNYTGKDVVADIVDSIPQYTSYVEESASHNGTYAGGVVTWVLNVAKGESVTVSFKVQVDEIQAIIANTAVVRDGVNTYYTNEVVNHTVEEVVEKDVFLASDATTSIDGAKVQAGDELVYTISYINTTAEEINIMITDTIPAHTTYVEESADNGGVYGDGIISWNLENVPAWGRVVVSFKVTVDTDVKAATIENIAKVEDGYNEYTTNQVTNYTEDDEEEKKETIIIDDGEEQESQGETKPSSGPKTGDSTATGTWSILMFTSLMACGVLLIIEKKRRNEV